MKWDAMTPKQRILTAMHRGVPDRVPVYIVLHSCGSAAEALPLIVEAGFDGLNPLERKAMGNDPFVFAEKYGDQLAFVGTPVPMHRNERLCST